MRRCRSGGWWLEASRLVPTSESDARTVFVRPACLCPPPTPYYTSVTSSTMFPEPSSLHTPGFAHYSIAWSPFHANRLALASAANYGLIGNGRVHLVSLSPQNPPQSLGRPVGPLPTPHIEKFFPTQDGIYDVAWSEIHENQLVSASGDGSLRLWDVTLNVSIRPHLPSPRFAIGENSEKTRLFRPRLEL